MTRAAVLLAAVLAAALLAACGLEPKPRTLPPGFDEPRFLLVSDEAQGPLLLGDDAGLVYSLDGGRTWSRPAAGRQPALAAAPFRDRLLVSRGLTGQAYDYGLGSDPDPRTAWPFRGAVTLLAGGARRWRLWAVTLQAGRPSLHYSNDGGVYWWTLPAVGLCPRPLAMAAGAPDERDVERLWVACGRRGLMASDDLGASFHAVPGIADARAIAASRGTPGRIVVATPTVMASRDAGRTWVIRGTAARAVAIDPRNPDLVFAATTDGRLLASLDGGGSF